jgi:hypothetical protein
MAKHPTVSTRFSKKTPSGKVVGKLKDGVTILTPRSKPKHFTSKEIRSTIQELRRASTWRA